MTMLSIDEINHLDQDAFTRAFGGVFEHSSWIAKQAWNEGPFSTLESLHSAMCSVLASASEDKQLELIRLHPDLGERLATLTDESSAEQKAAGLASLSVQEQQQFAEHNALYKQRFGFPFIICARLNDKTMILDAFNQRLHHDRETEIATALREIESIARLRLENLIS